MLKHLSIDLSKKNLSNAQSGWNEAITDAETLIAEHLERVQRLRNVVKTLKQLRDEGAVLPEITDGETESIN